MIDIKESKNKPEKLKKTIDDKNNKKDENEFKKKETKEIKDSELDIEVKKTKQLEEDLKSIRDEKLRLLAEMENLRKRFEKEKIESIKFGSINLARDILLPCDNLSRALESLSDEEKNNKKNQGLIKGLEMVQQEIISILEKNGIKKINALNEKFDHNLHQAMAEIESDKESGIVLKELQTGYTMHDRLLRPSMVVLSKKKEQNEDKNYKNDEDE
tara:strand:- start:14 stop:658 length:645 start_codon:yes stop_codon:yes gene_type:complete